MNPFISLFVIAQLLLLCLVAGAADQVAVPATAAPGAVAVLLEQTIFPVVGSFLMGVLSIFLHRLGERYKIETLTRKNNIVERAAFQGITLAEEKAAQYLKSKATLTGREKLDIAIAHVCSVIPRISADQAERIVEGMLAQIPGLGASGSLAVTPPSAGNASSDTPVPDQTNLCEQK